MGHQQRRRHRAPTPSSASPSSPNTPLLCALGTKDMGHDDVSPVVLHHTRRLHINLHFLWPAGRSWALGRGGGDGNLHPDENSWWRCTSWASASSSLRRPDGRTSGRLRRQWSRAGSRARDSGRRRRAAEWGMVSLFSPTDRDEDANG